MSKTTSSLVFGLVALCFGLVSGGELRADPTSDYCEGRLGRSIAVKGSCEYVSDDGVYTFCFNFIGTGITDDLIKFACMGAPKGVQAKACPTAAVSQICAKDPSGQYWAERIAYLPVPANAPNDDCKDENGLKAILCRYP